MSFQHLPHHILRRILDWLPELGSLPTILTFWRFHQVSKRCLEMCDTEEVNERCYGAWTSLCCESTHAASTPTPCHQKVGEKVTLLKKTEKRLCTRKSHQATEYPFLSVKGEYDCRVKYREEMLLCMVWRTLAPLQPANYKALNKALERAHSHLRKCEQDRRNLNGFQRQISYTTEFTPCDSEHLRTDIEVADIKRRLSRAYNQEDAARVELRELQKEEKRENRMMETKDALQRRLAPIHALQEKELKQQEAIEEAIAKGVQDREPKKPPGKKRKGGGGGDEDPTKAKKARK